MYPVQLVPTWLILVGVLILVGAATEAGFRLGRRCEDADRTDVGLSAGGAIKGASLALSGLVLAFSYGMALARYDLRTQVVVREAQALSTCWSMSGLLPPEQRAQAAGMLRSLIEARLRLFHDGASPGAYAALMAEVDDHVRTLRGFATAEFASAAEPVRLLRFLDAANDVSSMETEREWAVQNRVPGSLLVLLLLSVGVTGLLTGHSSGQAGRRQWLLWIPLSVLMVSVLAMVIDLDRPSRGLIWVSHAPLERLLIGLDRADQAAPDGESHPAAP